MHFEIRRMRSRGKPLESRKLSSVQPVKGDVWINMEPRSPMGRPSLSASILKVPPYSELDLPPLYDVQIHGMATLALVITGVEIIDGVAFAQSWHCRVA